MSNFVISCQNLISFTKFVEFYFGKKCTFSKNVQMNRKMNGVNNPFLNNDNNIYIKICIRHR